MKTLLLKTPFFLLFLFSLLLIPAKDAHAVACTEPSPSGNYAVAADCSFGRATIDGVDAGDITINANITLTITSGQTVVWNPGKQIVITAGASIQNGGGSLFQGDLYAVDEDADTYGKSTTDATSDYPQFYSSSGVNRVRVNTLLQRDTGFGDCQDTNAAAYTCYSYSQSSYYRQSTYYRQGTYYRYSQGSYYRQGTYYRYSQGTYYTSVCFTGKTKVAMADGTFKEIKDIVPGDVVISYNLTTGEEAHETVTKLIVHTDNPGGYLVINGILEVTSNHLVWSPNKNSWVQIGTLEVGDSLLNSKGETILIQTIDKVEGAYTVYNLALSGPNHNFFTEDFLVHNHKVGMVR